MNRIFYNTLIFICALFVGGVVVVFSIRPGIAEVKPLVGSNEKVWSEVILTKTESNVYKIKEDIVDITTVKVSQNTPMLVDFGRLSSFLYLAPLGSHEWVLTQSGATGIVIGDAPGIVSLYDLFLSYTVYDNKNNFRIEQITNGSFYIGKEEDGKVAIYAIDSAIRLTLISQGKDMTNLMLFPGSYIRFDTSRNRSLNNADLFRTILSLKDTDGEVFEFVNPRVNIGDEQDTFFNYRLPNSSIRLFRILSAQFKQDVEAKNNLRQKYAVYGYNDTIVESQWLFNPSKKNHNMLVELGSLLAKALNANTNSDAVIGKIGKIYAEATALHMQDSTAKSLVEQFLLDGRFAQYGWSVNTKYKETYEGIAAIIGIKRTDARWELFQNLADIYSRNLFNQKSTDQARSIDTYGPTANELVKTLDRNEIPQKDYFDIAIYAFNILKKMEEKSQVLQQGTMEEVSTYTYFTTFFRASNKYIESITDLQKKEDTIMSFSRQFYDSILTLLVNSLYNSYVVAEDGGLFLDPNYREVSKVKIPDDIIESIKNLNATVEIIAPSIQKVLSNSWDNDTDADAYVRINSNIVRLNAFVTMIDPETYKDYIKTPYKINSESGEIQFPLIDADTNLVVRLDSKTVEKIKNIKTLAIDPRIQELKKIWPDSDASSLSIEWNNIRIEKAPYKIGRSGNGTSSISMSALYKDKTLTDNVIHYGDYIIRVVTETNKPLSLSEYKWLLLDLESYLDFIDTEVTAQNREVGEMRIFPTKYRINIGDSIYPVSIKSR